MYHLDISYEHEFHLYHESVLPITEKEAIGLILYSFKTMNRTPFLTRQIYVKEDMVIIETYSGQYKIFKDVINGQTLALNLFKTFINLYNIITPKQIYCDKFRPWIYTCPMCMEQNTLKPSRETNHAIVFKCGCGHEYHHVKKRRERNGRTEQQL